MIAMLGSWLGFDASDPMAQKKRASPPPSPPKPLAIGGATARRSRSPHASMPRTKSHELLASAEVISFLCMADESIKTSETPLDAAVVDRLETMQTQAAIDDCDVLSDIIDHLQDENDRLKRVLVQRRFGGSASAPLYSAYPAAAAAGRLVSA